MNNFLIDKSDKEIESLYKEYPLCKIEYINNDLNEHIIEVRLDRHNVTITFYLSNEYRCIGSYLFFDEEIDEGLFRQFLVLEAGGLNLIDKWLLLMSRLKIQKVKDCFCFKFLK